MLVAVGCGGSGDSGAAGGEGEITVETGSLTKAQFVKRADAMCEKSRSQAASDYADFVKKEKKSQSADSQRMEVVKVVLVPLYSKLIDQISSLGAPSGDEEQVAGFLNGLQEDLDYASEQPSNALSGSTPFDRAAKLAKAYGLTGCARSLS